MKTRKKILSFILTLTLIIILLQAQIFASEVARTKILSQTNLPNSEGITSEGTATNANKFIESTIDRVMNPVLTTGSGLIGDTGFTSEFSNITEGASQAKASLATYAATSNTLFDKNLPYTAIVNEDFEGDKFKSDKWVYNIYVNGMPGRVATKLDENFPWKIVEVDGVKAAHYYGNGVQYGLMLDYCQKVYIKTRFKVEKQSFSYPLGVNVFCNENKDWLHYYPFSTTPYDNYFRAHEALTDVDKHKFNGTYEVNKWYDAEYYFDGQRNMYQIFIDGRDITNGGHVASAVGITADYQTMVSVMNAAWVGEENGLYVDYFEAYCYDEHENTDLQATIEAPDKLEVTSIKAVYTPNPFEIKLNLENTTDIAIKNIKAELNLPEGLTLVEGNNEIDIDSIEAKAINNSINWKVMASPGSIDRIEKYNVVITADNIDSKTIEKQITIPKLINEINPSRQIGYMYEQTIDIDNSVEIPIINSVKVELIDKSTNTYSLTVENYECDDRADPFFYWIAKEAMLTKANPDFTQVTCTIDKGKQGRNIPINVYLGDNLGYINKYTIWIKAN